MTREKVTKADLVDRIYESNKEVSRKDIHNILDCFFDEIKDSLEEDSVIELRGFGTFEIRTRKGREKARNPKTGEIVSVSNHGVAIFRPGKELKQIAWDLRE
ncbi:MAG: HU family DNA-binding protein [Spirochaetia bacterium]